MVFQSAAKFTAIRADRAGDYEEIAQPETRFLMPSHWRSPFSINPYAVDARASLIRWMDALGCTAVELEQVIDSRAAEYVGLAFPELSLEKTVRLSKYLSMWLLWDDLQIEMLESKWKLSVCGNPAMPRPREISRYDAGWVDLLNEYAVARSPAWIARLCMDMEHWSRVAILEGEAVARYNNEGLLPTFEEHTDMRIVTIGMYPIAYLIEDALDWEFSDAFHASPNIKTIKKLAGLMVGIGNEVFSLAKDIHEEKINLAMTLASERAMSARQSIDHLIRLHNAAVTEFDILAANELKTSAEPKDRVDLWLRFLRYSCAGFTLWESRAERYTRYKVLEGGRVQRIAYP